MMRKPLWHWVYPAVAFSVAVLFTLLPGRTIAAPTAGVIGTAAPYQAKDFSGILGMQGISDKTLNNHFKLYQAYVTNTNLLLQRTNQLLTEGKENTPEFSELRRRFGFEFNGMRLHELYFANLKGDGKADPISALYKQIVQDFGSFDRWNTDFIATGKMRGDGWAILFYDPMANRLMNVWINDHEMGVPTGLQPILVMDAWEHAYYMDTTNRAEYITVFMKNANWREVESRFAMIREAMQKMSTK